MLYTKGYRYGVVPGSDNKYTTVHKETQNPAYALTLAIVAQSPDSTEVVVDVKTLTGALTVTADVNQPYTGDKLVMLFKADGSSRVVTPSTGFLGGGTITVAANKCATAEYVFSGAMQSWVEKSRFVQP